MDVECRAAVRRIEGGSPSHLSRNCYSIAIVVSGQGQLAWDGMSEEIAEGDVILSVPIKAHSYNCTGSEPLVLHDVEFTDGFLKTLNCINDMPDVMRVFFIDGVSREGVSVLKGLACGQSREISGMMAAMVRESDNRSEGYETVIFGYLTIIIGTIYRFCAEKYGFHHGGERQRLSKALSYLHQTDGIGVRIDDLAKLTGWSVHHFSHVFKGVTGRTIPEYIRQLKVNRGMLLLLSSDRPLEDIAEVCGYYDASTFRHAFKTCLGITPEMYRRQHKTPGQQVNNPTFWGNLQT